MFFHQGQHFLYVGGVGDGLFDVLEGEEFLADDPAEAFGDLLLSFGEDAMESKAQDLFGLSGMEKEFEGHPDREPVNKGGDKRYCIKPPAECCHVLCVFNKKAPRETRSFGWMMGLEPTTLRTTI